jgi:uncharacterized protein
MKERSLSPESLDVAALCKQGATLDGHWPLARMSRLAESFCAASDGRASWMASGSLRPVVGGEPELWLHLRGQAEVPLQCQRCLQAMTEPLVVDRRFRFVRSEEQAAALDEESEEDVLALPARLDLTALLEDEFILALPIVPRHAVCPDPLPLPADEPDVEPAPHPFAALAGLRGKPGGQG